MNTPHPQYRKMGVSTMGVVTETRSSIDANVYWPEKDASLSLAVIHVQPGEVRAKFQVQAPVEKLSRLSIEGGYIFPESLVKKNPSPARISEKSHLIIIGGWGIGMGICRRRCSWTLPPTGTRRITSS